MDDGHPGSLAARDVIDLCTARTAEDHVRGERGPASIELALIPSRVLTQDFTGMPAIVDLAAMRDAIDVLVAIHS